MIHAPLMNWMDYILRHVRALIRLNVSQTTGEISGDVNGICREIKPEKSSYRIYHHIVGCIKMKSGELFSKICSLNMKILNAIIKIKWMKSQKWMFFFCIIRDSCPFWATCQISTYKAPSFSMQRVVMFVFYVTVSLICHHL